MSRQSELEPAQSLLAIEEEEFKREAAGAHDKLVCWISAAAPGQSLLQEILDISVFAAATYSKIAVSAGVSQKLIEVAEAAGYSHEMCSYYKVVIGYALLLSRGQLDTVPGVPIMPRPDFMWVTNGCTSSLHSGEALGSILDVPVIGIDVPFEYDVAHRERFLDYVEGQLEEGLDFLEMWTGRPFDWPRLKDRIRGLAEVADMRNALDQAHKNCPSACTAFDVIPAKWVHRAYRIEESKRMYGALKEKIERETERGNEAVRDEIRLTFLGAAFPWAKMGVITEILARHGANLCTSHVSSASPGERGEGLDAGNPLRTVARMYKRDYRAESLDTYLEDWVKPYIEGYNIDGAILHASRTCKNLGIPLLAEAAELQEKLGVPTFILESDSIDTTFFSQTEVENRLGSFLDGIARRKAEAREGLQKR